MIELQEIATNIYKGEDGLWKTIETEGISYTQDGHKLIQESEQKSFWFEHRLNCLSLIFDLYHVDTVLDIGGGNGEVSKFLQTKKVDSVLIEPRLEGASNAFQNGVKNVVHGSLLKSGLKNRSAEGIMLLDVLEHIKNDDSFLEELFRVLAPNGKLFLSVPAYSFLFSDFDREVGHFRRYTLNKLKEKLTHAGFQIQYQTYLFYVLPIPVFFTRLFYKFFRNKRKRRKLGHLNKKGLMGKFLHFLLSPELFFVKRKVSIPFGSSCFVVAQKPDIYG